MNPAGSLNEEGKGWLLSFILLLFGRSPEKRQNKKLDVFKEHNNTQYGTNNYLHKVTAAAGVDIE